MRSLALLASMASVATASRYVLYFDQWHTKNLPPQNLTKGVTHVITAFANSSLFLEEVTATYEPFMPLADIRALFAPSTKICMAIGGWGDTDGFSKGSATESTRAVYAQKVAQTAISLGYDCVDVDWEYPGGNGEDYKVNPNSNKTAEIPTYPLLLKAIKDAIAPKELSIAVPGLERDMMAYCASSIAQIDEAVDFVNVMSYDLMNRRDNLTTHHSSLKGALRSVETYLQRGFSAEKLVLGFPFYAKYFTLAFNTTCDTPTGCQAAVLEDPVDGADLGLSGVMTFEETSFAPIPADLAESTNATCGFDFMTKCPAGSCCSQYNSCGETAAHCGTGCQYGFTGKQCTGFDIRESFHMAVEEAQYDEIEGGHWWVDEANHVYWTFDTAEDIGKKYEEIVIGKGLGGVMAWSLAEDSWRWERLRALTDCVNMAKNIGESETRRRG